MTCTGIAQAGNVARVSRGDGEMARLGDARTSTQGALQTIRRQVSVICLRRSRFLSILLCFLLVYVVIAWQLTRVSCVLQARAEDDFPRLVPHVLGHEAGARCERRHSTRRATLASEQNSVSVMLFAEFLFESQHSRKVNAIQFWRDWATTRARNK